MNCHDVNKSMIGVRVPLEVKARLRRLAQERKTTMSDLVSFVIYNATKDVTLDDDDLDWIKEQTRINIQRRSVTTH